MLHKCEVALTPDNFDIWLKEAKILGGKYVHALEEQNRRQTKYNLANMIVISEPLTKQIQ